ncbi:YchJ family protein [Actinokineospora globicatena]|uniref:YchJ family protein n=1 Tax=Actinokineospora globicatena TaxID=103729 RepID=UPI0020A46A3C|nr:YchJ family protein [Actinokineospora globicatena]MCP2302787.1 SEC-C motif-containing protein [Actinokineospora globicatena]GLW75522.1 UPF0225 protein [Actinokineospora globicatena]GLW82363.1 UPF0225 protein [Actinokineospora globicatena]
MSERCPCGTGLPYDECCGRAHSGTPAPTAEALMRSRYTAFTLGDVDYLTRTWHPDTRPVDLTLDPDQRWTRLDILSTEAGTPFHTAGTVEFRAHYTRGGHRDSLHERSRFTRENGKWLYLDGDIRD